ncbi:hypothetical protein [Undibacterium sp. CY21W]|jgi:hypothetical protein|uniref:hypothetical protein n=1 Tax=Undibacterium sp. CY21W TaxID=2762293 RepID=UPI00164A2BDA|nr:hypothetical protein [Undibacterium sp. CY21W]MBC3927158.1 hypothetical protein [Undibacterium sp. CY21W]
MNVLINELKTRARLWLTLLQSDNANARKRAQVLCRQHRWDIPDGWQLRHCLNLAAADIGFSHWEHARHVLSGQAQAGDDMGDFWHGPEVAGLSNLWYANYADADKQLQADPHLYLLPYRRQFMLVSTHYLEALQLNLDAGLWHGLQRNLTLAYASPAWQALALQRLQTSRVGRFAQ